MINNDQVNEIEKEIKNKEGNKKERGKKGEKEDQTKLKGAHKLC